MARKIDLKRFKKIKIAQQVTPIKYLSNISKALGVDIFIKRDDLNEVGLGGNKTRKLAYLLGDAKSKKASHIITLGALQSNHARLTAASAIMNGFKCELFLKKSVNIANGTYHKNGNILLENILDTTIHFVENDFSVSSKIEDRVMELEEEGYKPYYIPVGGSNSLGSLGYFDCFYEIKEQENKLKESFTHICVATGSGGTHAGLIAANTVDNLSKQIIGYNVQPEEDELRSHTFEIVNNIFDLIDYPKQLFDESNLSIRTQYAGSSYGIPENIHLETIKFVAKHEGIFLDPVYTSKAFTGILLDIENGFYTKGDKILFIHTGGVPGLFAYADFFN